MDHITIKQTNSGQNGVDDRFRAIADSAPAFIYVLDATGELTFVNKTFIDFHGLSLAQLRRMDPGGPLHPDDRDQSVSAFFSALQARQPFHMEFRLKSAASGAYRWLLNSAVPTFSDKGEFSGYVGTCVDITHRRQAEEQSKFQARALSQVSDAVVALDNEWRISYWNAAAERLYGYSTAEALGRELQDVVHYRWVRPEDEATASLALANTGVWRGENFVLKKDGGEIWTESSVSVLRNDAGRQSGILAVVRDITRSKTVEQAYRNSEERFRLQFKSTPVPIFSWQRQDREFVLVDFNDAASAMTGGKISSLLGKRASPIYRNTPEFVEYLERCYRQQSTIRREADFRLLTTGELKHLDVSFVFVPPDLVLIHTEDITERRRSENALREAERKYRDIFENATEGMFQTTPDGQFIEANPALARMLGFTAPEQLIRERTNLQKAYVDQNRRGEFKRLITENNIVRGFEYETYRRDGSKIWMSENVRAVRDDHGAILYYEGTAEEITERKKADARSLMFATLARKLSGARSPLDAAKIIVETADNLFGWDSCALDLYDHQTDLIAPLLYIDTIDEQRINVTPLTAGVRPCRRRRQTIDAGAELVLRQAPFAFDAGSFTFGNVDRPSVSLMSVPIRHGARIIGILSIHSYQPQFYNEGTLAHLQSLADLCGEAINRIKAEGSLVESEERFRQIAENIEDVIWMVDSDVLKALYVNPAYERIWGRPGDHLYQRIRSFVQSVHPEDRQKAASMINQQVLGSYQVHEFRIVRPDGSIRWIKNRSFPIKNAEGKIYRLAGVAEDITERKLVEDAIKQQKELLQTIFDNVPVAINLLDEQGNIKLVNPAWERILGWTYEEVTKEGFDIFKDAYPDPDYRKEVVRFLLDSKNEWADFRTRVKDGRVIDTSWAVARLSDGTQIGIGQDVTDRKQAQRSLQEFSRRLIKAQEEERRRIAHELHDEIGQMLTAVRLNFQAVQRACDTPACSPYIEDSIRVVDDALKLVRDLSFDLRPSLLDDLGLIAALRWYVERYAQRNGLRAEVAADAPELERRLPREIETAAFRIVQEALANVVRHAQAKRVLVELKPVSSELVLRIRDDGAGFNYLALKKNGVPLATVGLRGMEERAKAVGGRLEIESDLARGTEIRVRLPVSQSF